MSNVKISALPAGTSLVDTDTLPVVRAGVTTRVNTGTLVADVATAKTNIAALQAQTNPFPALTALDQSSWSWVNQGGASITQGNNIVWFTVPPVAGENMRLRVVAAPVTAYTITSLLVPNPIFNTSFQAGGICFYESGSGKIISLLFRETANLEVRKNTSATVFSSDAFLSSAVLQSVSSLGLWMRISDNLTSITFSYSLDGFNFNQVYTEARGAFFTTAPDRIGLAMFNVGTTIPTAGISYLSWAQT